MSLNNNENYNLLKGDSHRKIFKIPVNNIPEEEIEEYIRNIAKKIKSGNITPIEESNFNIMEHDEDIFIPNYNNNMSNAFYCQSVPNSHWWTDLHQILSFGQYQKEQLTKEHLIVGLNNSIKHGYKLKPYREIDLKNFEPDDKFFSTIELMIKYIESKEFDVNQFLSMVDTTMDIIGLNLNNGIIMEKTDVYKVVDSELLYQDSQQIERDLLDGVPDSEKPVAEWLNYIEYHLSKAKDCIYHLDKDAALAEVRKVTALGVRTMMIHGAIARKSGEILNPLDLNPTTMKPRCSCDNDKCCNNCDAE